MTRTPEVGVDHLTMLDVQHLQIWRPSPMRRDSTRSAFACQLDPDEESWSRNAGSPRFEETVCRLDDTNVRVLSVQVIRIDLDIKGRTTSPRWSQQPCWERVT